MWEMIVTWNSTAKISDKNFPHDDIMESQTDPQKQLLDEW